jgi:vancomycin resistance protein VanW
MQHTGQRGSSGPAHPDRSVEGDLGGDIGDLSRLGLARRRAGIGARQAARLASWVAGPASWRRPELADPRAFPHELHRRRWPITLDPPAGAAAELLEEGKRINLALAAPHVSGAVIAPDRPFSFWRAVPRPTATRGFRIGREVRGGCVVPTPGGGLCLLSSALFAAGAELGWRILERHGHTMIADHAAGGELDATVLWPHVDLRFAPRAGSARLEVVIAGGDLIVAVHGDRPSEHRVEIHRLPRAELEQRTARGTERVIAVRRVVRDRATGALIEDALVVLDRRRVVPTSRATRNCLTCDRDCRARPADLPALATAAPAAHSASASTLSPAPALASTTVPAPSAASTLSPAPALASTTVPPPPAASAPPASAAAATPAPAPGGPTGARSRP